MLGPGVRRRTPCAASARQLRSNSFGEPDNDARVLRHALTPGPALLGTVRRGWERAPHGPLLRSACGPSLRSARQGGCTARRQRAPRASPTPGAGAKQQRSGTRAPPRRAAPRRAGPGVSACRRTRASSSGSPKLFDRSCLAEAAQGVLRRHPRTEHHRLPHSPTGRVGTRAAGSSFLGLPSFDEAKEGRCAAGRTSRPPPQIKACSHHQTASDEGDPCSAFSQAKATI